MTVRSGAVEIEAEASRPRARGLPSLVLAHPHPAMGGDMHNKVIDQLFRRSAEKGWGAVRFNFRGVGASTGSYGGGAGETEDLLAVCKWALGEFGIGARDLSLVGYSFGSWIAARGSAALEGLRRLVLIAPPVATMDFSPLDGVRVSKWVFAAGRDEVVPREKLEAWYAALPPPKTLRTVDGADHCFTGRTLELIRAVLRAADVD